MAESEDDTSETPWRAIVGLGNPGERYRQTRHNVGFQVVEELADRFQLGPGREECNSRVWVSEHHRLLLVQPQTFMNRSGYAVRCLAERRSLDGASFLVVYDEVHLPLGRIRLRPKGSPAGHRGMESVIESLRTSDVSRLRCGVAGGDGTSPEGEALVDYVLSPFEEKEMEAVAEMIRRAADASEAWMAEGMAAAMNRFNG